MRDRVVRRIEITDLPTREARLSRLGLAHTANADRVRTGYTRVALDTLLNAGWLKQVELYDIEDADAAASSPQAGVAVQFGGYGFGGVSVLRAAWNLIVVGTHSGLVHIFDRDGSLQQTFQVGETTVSDLLVTARGLKAAYCDRRVTLFSNGQITGALKQYADEK